MNVIECKTLTQTNKSLVKHYVGNKHNSLMVQEASVYKRVFPTVSISAVFGVAPWHWRGQCHELRCVARHSRHTQLMHSSHAFQYGVWKISDHQSLSSYSIILVDSFLNEFECVKFIPTPIFIIQISGYSDYSRNIKFLHYKLNNRCWE